MIFTGESQAILLNIVLRLGGATGVLIAGRWLARLSRQSTKKLLAKTALTDSLKELTLKIVYFSVLGIAVIVALALLGIPTTMLIAAIGIVVVVLGIALQESISNFAATVNFLMFEPFNVGDLIETSDKMGVVSELQVFNTVLIQADGKVVILPNGKIQSDGLTNYSKSPALRVDLEVGIGYGDDLERARQTALDLLTADAWVLADPPPQVVVLELDDSSVTLGVRPFVKGEDYWLAKWDLTEKLKNRFDEAGITIPYPQSDVHLVSMKEEGNG
jgi:small conductance mechanosensitive channel